MKHARPDDFFFFSIIRFYYCSVFTINVHIFVPWINVLTMANGFPLFGQIKFHFGNVLTTFFGMYLQFVPAYMVVFYVGDCIKN